MEIAGVLFNKSLALVVENHAAQTARKRLEEHSYWDNTRRLTKITNKHIAIPVNGQCGRALLSTERKGIISFLHASYSNTDGDDWSKMGTHQSAGLAEPMVKSSSSETGVTSNIRTLADTPCCCSSPETAQVTSPNISSRKEAHQSESGVQSNIRTLADTPCCCSSPETALPTSPNISSSEEAESGVQSNIRTLTDPPCCCDSPKKVLYTSPNISSSEEALALESGSQPLLSSAPSDAGQHPCPRCGHNHSTTATHGQPHAIYCGKIFDFEATLVCMDLPPSKKAQLTTPYDRLRAMIDGWVKEGRIQWKEELAKEIPKNWDRHGDMVLLPSSCFLDHAWSTVPDFWSMVASTLNCTRIARRGRIRSDDFRSPRTEILLGTDPYVEHRDNGINYTFDIRYSMFSSGNITEKLRIADLDCAEETVVDLYAGIGYFTLPYLVHAKAKLMYACEWNPHAVQALRNNLKLNSVNERCVVLEGDNRKVCPKGVASRVNLGLIPSSEQGWPVACAALNPATGGILHIHGNVASYPNKEWTGPNNTNSSVSKDSMKYVDPSHCNDHDGRFSPTKKWTDPSCCQCGTKNVDSRLDNRLLNTSSDLIEGCRHAADDTRSEQTSVQDSQAHLALSRENNVSQSHSSCQASIDAEEILPSNNLLPNEARSDQQVTGVGDCTASDAPMECSQGATMPARERTSPLQQLEQRDLQPVAAKDHTLDRDTVECTGKCKTGSIPNGKPGNTRGEPCPSTTKNSNVSGCETEEESQATNQGMHQSNLFNKKFSENCSELKREKWIEWGCNAVNRIKHLLCEQHGNRWSVEMLHIEHVKSYAPHIDHLVVDINCRPIT